MVFKKLVLPPIPKITNPGVGLGLSAPAKFKKLDLGYSFSYAPEPKTISKQAYSPTPVVTAKPYQTINSVNRDSYAPEASIKASQKKVDAKSIVVPNIGFGNTPEADAAYRASVASGKTKIEPERRTNLTKGISAGVLGLKTLPSSVAAGIARGSEIGMRKIVNKEAPDVNLFGNTSEYEEAYKNWVKNTGGPAVTARDRASYASSASASIAADQRMLRVVATVEKEKAARPELYLPETGSDGKVSKVNQFVYELGQGAVSQIAALTISAITGGAAAPIVAPLFGIWAFGSKYADAVGAGVDTEKAYNSATISGLVNWIGEYVQLRMFGAGKNILASSGKEVQSALTVALKGAAFKNKAQVMARVAQLTAGAAKVATVAKGLGVGSIARTAGNDIIENAAQEFIESVGSDAGDYASGVKELTWDSFWASTGNAFKSAAFGAILAGGTSVAIGGTKLNIDRAELANVQNIILDAKATLESRQAAAVAIVERLKGANPTSTMANLQMRRGVLVPQNMNATGFATAVQIQPVVIFAGELSGENEMMNNWAKTAEISRQLGGVKPNLGTYTGMDGETTNEHSFILTDIEAGFRLAAAADQESVLYGDGLGHWWFIDPRTKELLGTASEINFSPVGDKTRVTLSGKKGIGFSFDNVNWGIEVAASDKLVAVIENKANDDSLSSAGMGYNENGQLVYGNGQFTGSGTTSDYGGANEERTGNAGGTLSGKFSGTSVGSTDVVTPTGVLSYRPLTVNIEGKSLTVIQSWDGDASAGANIGEQIDTTVADIDSGNVSSTGILLDSQHLSGPAFSDIAFPGIMASATDLTTRLKSGKTVILWLSSLQGAKAPKIAGESGRWLFTSMRNNAIFKGVVKNIQPEIIEKSKNDVANWNAENPTKPPKGLFDLQLLSNQEKLILNEIATSISDEYNIERGGKIYGAYILKNVTPEQKYAAPLEGENILKAYDKIYTGLYVKFDDVKDMPVLQDVLNDIQNQVVVEPGKNKPGTGGFYQPQSAQTKPYTITAPLMAKLVATVRQALILAKAGGIEGVASMNALSDENINKVPPLSQVGLDRIAQSYASIKGSNIQSTVSNYQTQYGEQQYSGTGPAPTTINFTAGGNPVLLNQQNQPVPVLPKLLGIKPSMNFLTQSKLSHAEELAKDDINVLRELGYADGYTYKLLTAIRGSSTITEYALLHGMALLPDGKKQAFAPGVKLMPFMELGETLKRNGLTEENLNRFSILYAASRGNPVNVDSMPDVNLTKQGKGPLAEKLAKVKAKAMAELATYSPEQYSVLKGVMDEAHKYLIPIVNAMHAKGMPLGENLDSGAISVDEWIDSYVSSAEPRSGGLYGSSSPMQEKHIETVSHKQVTGYLNGIVNTMNNYNQWFMYNEYVKRFATEMGYVSEKEIKGAPAFFADDGKVMYVSAPEHIQRQLTSVVNRTKSNSRFFNSDIYNTLMTASRELKLMTPAFAQTNIIRDASLVLIRAGIHPVAMANTVLKLVMGKSEKSSGLVGMGTPNELTGNVLRDFQNIDHAVALTHVQRIFQYLHDNVLGISESLMRNYAYNVEKASGKSEIEQMYALIASSTDFTVYGSSQAAANIRKAWQFGQANLDAAMSWDLAIKELGTKMKSDNLGTKFEGFSGAALIIAGIAAGIAFKAREKERKELQEFVTQNKIPIRIGENKILTIPEGFNTGALLENTISTIVAGIMSGDSIEEISGGLAHDIYAGVVGYIGRDGDAGINSIISTMTPTLFEPLVRNLLNVQYGGGLIDPMTWGNNWTHYFKSTTNVAKAIARTFNDLSGGAVDLSPIKLDYLFKSYLARYGTALTKLDTSGAKSAVSGFMAQQFVIPVPEGIKTQAYADWKVGYAKIANDLDEAKKGNYPMSQDMENDLRLLGTISLNLPKQTTAQGVFGLAIFGLSVLDTYAEHKKERRKE
jgi:hypothetical protein